MNGELTGGGLLILALTVATPLCAQSTAASGAITTNAL